MDDWGTVQVVAALIAAFGGGAGLKTLAQGLYHLLTGKQRGDKNLVHRYRDDYEKMRNERDGAISAENREYYRRRVMEDHAAECRRVIIIHLGKEWVPEFPVDGHPWREHKSIIEPPNDGFPDGIGG